VKPNHFNNFVSMFWNHVQVSWLYLIYSLPLSIRISDSETNLLKFESGISNDLVSLLYLPVVTEIITLSAAPQLVRWHGN
jgi:hypothetical protein